MKRFLICLFTFDHYAAYKGEIIKINKTGLSFWKKVHVWWWILWQGETDDNQNLVVLLDNVNSDRVNNFNI